MTVDQAILFALLTALFAMLVWGRFRYDVVAFAALVVAVVTGVVPIEAAFSGFGHPATVIIALVLVVSRGLSNSGAIELIARHLADGGRRLQSHIAILGGTAAALSALMNNVAALALLMPVDMQAAAKAKRNVALSLMPLSFATILGGMVTLIGTPPNIVIAAFRTDALGAPFTMFDFAPVGIVVAVVGVTYVALAGWRLLPKADVGRAPTQELAELEEYVAEAKAGESSPVVGNPLGELYPLADEHDVSVVGLVRRGKRLRGSAREEIVRKSDHVVIEGAAEAIEQFVGAAKLEYVAAKAHGGLLGEALKVIEVVIPDGASIVGRSAMDVRLSSRKGVMLLAVSRRGRRFRERVRKLPLRAGDVLLLAGTDDRLADVTSWLGVLPLAPRGLHVTQRHKAWLAILLFAAAILLASLGLVYLPVALAAVVVLFAGVRIVPPRQLYDAVEWPVIVLLGSLIPIAGALESSGGTARIAEAIVGGVGGLPPWIVLTILMVVTMTLSDVLNNVATALIAAPIAVDIATRLHVAADPFLMAVAVASSCAFLTPIGHKNNTIIMGPGGYSFGDYWRMGLPLEILVVLVGVPMILLVWPL